jgi:gluconolactonase
MSQRAIVGRLAAVSLVAAACGATAPSSDGTSGDATAADTASVDAPGRDVVDPADANGGDVASPDGGTPSVCPAGSSSLVLDLAGVTLARVAGVPISDGFAPGSGIIEGPVWARGALYVSHFGGGPVPASRIYRIDPAGGVTVAAPNAGTNGLAVGPDGRLYGARHADGSVSVFDWGNLGAAPTPIARTYMGARFNSPNDLALRSDGALYFTDPSWQAPSPAPQAMERAYFVARDGTVTAIAGAPSRPNGVALSRDEGTLFVAGTDGLRRFQLAADGSIASGPTNVPAASGGGDGLGVDCAGNLYVTGNNRVLVLDAALARVGELAAPGATNVAFGGADQRTLYVTAGGNPPAVLSARVNVPGRPY